MSSRRTAYTSTVLQEVQAQAREAETQLAEVLDRLEEETIEDENRSDWGSVPALEADDGHETTSDAQLRGALNDARDSLAEVEALVDEMLADPDE